MMQWWWCSDDDAVSACAVGLHIMLSGYICCPATYATYATYAVRLHVLSGYIYYLLWCVHALPFLSCDRYIAKCVVALVQRREQWHDNNNTVMWHFMWHVIFHTSPPLPSHTLLLVHGPKGMHMALARAVYAHRIWTYLWLFPCYTYYCIYRIHTMYTYDM